MRILPIVIILLCSSIILKGSVLIEKHLTKSYEPIRKDIAEDSAGVSSSIEYLSEEKSLSNSEEGENLPKDAASTDKKKDDSKPDPYPNADFVKECINQPMKYNDIEVQMLENLSNRRKELDEKESQLNEKQKLIEIAAAQVEDKLKQVKDLQSSVQDLLAKYNEKEDSKIQSLVRIYQAMKPADAAKIFDELDMEILLQVISKMKETNAASIIANMNPAKAKDLTIKIARQKELTNAE